MVSTNTPMAWTKPCSHGWFASAMELAWVAVPMPASLESRPLLRPWAMATPKAPPNTADGLKAPPNTAATKAGTLFRFRMISRAITAIYRAAITGTARSENLTTLLIPPKVMTAIITTMAAAMT